MIKAKALPLSLSRRAPVDDLPVDRDENSAQRSSIEESVRWYNTATIAMKIAAGALAFAFLAIGGDAYLIGKLRGPGLVTVYTPTSGGLALAGTASEAVVPSDAIVIAGVRSWLLDVRCLHGIAPCDFERNQARAMTDAKSTFDPKTHLEDYFEHVDKQRNADPTLTRAVLKSSIIPLPFMKTDAYRTFDLTWIEQVGNAKGVSAAVAHTGQITIANQHPVSGDPDIAQLNPNGIYVEQFSTDSDLR